MLSRTHCLSTLALFAVITASGIPRPTVSVARQGRERIVVVKDDFDPPVKIKAVRVKDREIKAGEKFLSDDDWLDGLAVSITNDTDKAIHSISMGVIFLRPDEQE